MDKAETINVNQRISEILLGYAVSVSGVGNVAAPEDRVAYVERANHEAKDAIVGLISATVTAALPERRTDKTQRALGWNDFLDALQENVGSLITAEEQI